MGNGALNNSGGALQRVSRYYQHTTIQIIKAAYMAIIEL